MLISVRPEEACFYAVSKDVSMHKHSTLRDGTLRAPPQGERRVATAPQHEREPNTFPLFMSPATVHCFYQIDAHDSHNATRLHPVLVHQNQARVCP